MDKDVEEVAIRLDLGGGSPERLAAKTVQLRQQLRRLDEVEHVSLARSGPPPPGARAGDALELGALIVAIVRTPGMIDALGGVLSNWIAARNQRTVIVQRGDDRIELTGLAREDQARLVRLFEGPPGTG